MEVGEIPTAGDVSWTDQGAKVRAVLVPVPTAPQDVSKVTRDALRFHASRIRVTSPGVTHHIQVSLTGHGGVAAQIVAAKRHTHISTVANILVRRRFAFLARSVFKRHVRNSENPIYGNYYV